MSILATVSGKYCANKTASDDVLSRMNMTSGLTNVETICFVGQTFRSAIDSDDIWFTCYARAIVITVVFIFLVHLHVNYCMFACDVINGFYFHIMNLICVTVQNCRRL